MMVSLNGGMLVMAIQAIDDAIDHLDAATADQGAPGVADLQEMLMSYIKAADDLKRVYIEACRTTLNLPAYEMLVRD